MRKRYQSVLKRYFHEHLVQTRQSEKLTQAQMAELLEMDERSYIELDHGKSSCSALTFALYLIYCCQDPLQFLSDLRKMLETEAEQAA